MSRTNANSGPSALSELIKNAQLAWRLLSDPRVPLTTKLIPAGALVYVLSPLDLIPDLIPILGQLDDIGVILLALRYFIQFSPADVVEEHRRALEGQPPRGGRGEYVDGTYRVLDP